MKNPLGYIGHVLLVVFIFSIILQSTSRDYVTTFTSETRSAEVPSPSLNETSTVRDVENADGSKTYFVDLSLNVKLSTSVSGQFFDSSKYKTYQTSIIIQEKTFDILKDIWDRYFKWITLFVAVLSIPIALLALIRKNPPF